MQWHPRVGGHVILKVLWPLKRLSANAALVNRFHFVIVALMTSQGGQTASHLAAVRTRIQLLFLLVVPFAVFHQPLHMFVPVGEQSAH